MSLNLYAKRAAGLIAVLTALHPGLALRGQTQWTAGSTTDLTWGNAGNWSVGVPTLADDVIFGSPIPNPGALGNPDQILLSAGSLANSLWFQNSYTLSGGNLSLTSGGLRVDSGKTVSIASELLGATLLSKTGGGTLILAGPNTFSGGIALNDGGLVALADDSLGTGLVTLRRGALTLADDLGLNLVNSVALTGSSSIVLDRETNGSAVNHTLGALSLGVQRLSVLSGGNVSSGTSGLTFGATTLTASGGVLDVAGDVNLTLGAISGNFNLIKTGAGSLTLAGASTRAGSTTFLTEGSLVIANPAGLGTAAAVLNMAGGTTLDLATDTTVNAHPLTMLGSVTVLSNRATAGDGVIQTLGALTSIGAKTITIDKGVNVTGGTAVTGFAAVTTTGDTTFDVAAGSRLTLASLNNTGNNILVTGSGDVTTGAITGGGGLTKAGAGTLTLTGASTFTGAFAIDSGSVVLGIGTGLGAAGVASPRLNGTSTLSVNGFAPSLLDLNAASGTTIQNGGATNVAMTLTPGVNSTSILAGTLQNGAAGTFGLTVNSAVGGGVTLTGNNTYSGPTILTAGQLNVNGATAIGTSAVTLTAGILDNTSGSAVTMSNNNAVTAGGNFTFGGSNSLNFGTGGVTSALGRVVTLAGNNGSTLRFNSWSQTGTAIATLAINVLPGSNSNLSIGTYNPQTTGTAVVHIIGGNGGNIAITGGIVPTVTAVGMNFSNAGTITLTGSSSYTGATTFTAGKVILDAAAGTATMAATTAPTFAGGSFEFRGNNTGTGQTLGNTTIGTGGSTLKVVGGTAGTTLALGATYTSTTNLGTMNIILDNTAGAAAVTTSQAAVNSILGARAATVVTNAAGVTEFAGKSGASVVQYTGQTLFSGTTTGTGTNYLVTGNQTLSTGAAQPYTLKINTTGPGESLSLGANTLQIMGGGLLFVGADDYTINGSAPNALRSGTATASDLIVHNYGLGQLDIATVIANGTGTSVVTISGTGTTRLSGVNTYTGATAVVGGATLSIGANSGLGAVATGAALTLNNGTLRITSTMALDNAGANIRPVTLGANGGKFDVTGSESLTVRGVVGGAGSLTKTGTGTLLLTTGVSTYSGGYTRIQEGAIQLGGATGSIAAGNFVVLGNGTNSGTLILGEAGSVKLQTVAGLFTSGTGTNNAIVAGGNAGNSTLTFAGNYATPSTFGGIIGGAGTNQDNLILAVTAGSLTLTGSNTYAGGTNLSGTGLLNLGSANAIGSGPLTIAGGNLDNTSGSAIALTNNLALNGNFVFGASNSLSFEPGTTVAMGASRVVTLLGSPTNTSTLSFDALNVTAPALTLTVNREQGSGVALNIGTLDLNTGASGAATVIAGTGLVNVGSLTATAANTPFTYSGTGVLTISGAATYGGLTSFTGAGTVRLLPGGNLPSTSGLTVSGGNTLDLNGQNQTVATLTLSAAGTITNTSLTPSTLISTNIAASSGHLAGNLAGDFTLTGAAAAMSGTYTNTGNLTFNNAGTGAFTVSGTVLNTGNVTFNANSNQALTISAPLFNPAGEIINSGTGTGTTTISASIGSAVTGITQDSATSALILTGANRSTGPLQVNAGLLQLSQVSALFDNNPTNWNTTNIIVRNGGTLGLSVGGASGFSTDDLDLLLSLASPTGGFLNGSTIALDTTNSGGTFTYAGNISNTDGGLNQLGLAKLGNGTLVLTGSHTYTGSTTISGGTLVADVPAGNLVLNGGVLETSGTFARGLGLGNNELRWTLGANGGFSAAGGPLDVTLTGAPSPLIWDGTPDFISGAGQLLFGSTTADDVVSLTNAIDLNDALRVVQVLDNPLVTSDRAVLSGVLSGTGGLNKTGAGVLALTGANTYSGVTTLTLGTLQLGNASNGGLGSGQLNLVAGTLQPLVPGISISNNVLLTANTLVGSESLTILGELTGNTGASRTLTNNLDAGRLLTLGRLNLTNDTGTTARAFTLTGTGDTTIAGTIANAPIGVTAGATPTLTISSTGLTLFQGANTYTGSTTLGSAAIAAGTLRVAAGSNLSVATTTVFSGTLDLQNGLQAIAGLTMGNGPLGTTSTVNLNNGILNLGGTVTYTASANSGTATITTGTLNLLGNRTFTINDSTQTDTEMVVDAVIANGDATARTVTKGGGGTLVLNAANTYTGTTTMSNGIMRIRGSIAEAGATALTASRLILDFEPSNVTKLNPASSLSLANSVLSMTGNASNSSSQTVNGLTINAGASRIELDHGVDQTMSLTLGAINRAQLAGTIDFDYTPGSGLIATSSLNSNGTILGGWATVNRSAFATVLDGVISAFASTTRDDVATWLSGEDISDSAGFFGTLGGDLTINSLRYSAADSASAVQVGANKTLRITSGGILITPEVNTGAASITGGFIAGTAGIGGAAGLELIVHQNNIGASFDMGSRLTGASIITKAGNGTMVISGANTHRGDTNLTQGTLIPTGGNGIGAYSQVVMRNIAGVTLDLNNGTERVAGLSGGGTLGGTVLVGSGTLEIANQSGSTRTYVGTLQGGGTLIKSGANAQIIQGNSSVLFTGNVVVNGGLLQMNGSAGRLGATNYVINAGGELLADQDQSSSQDRIANGATVVLNNTANVGLLAAPRGLWLRTVSQNATRVDTIGTVNVGSGHNIIQATNSAAASGTSQVGDMIITTLTRSNFATTLVRGQNLGAASGARGLIRPATAPAGVVGGAGAAASQTISIVPWIIGAAGLASNESEASVAAQTGNSFVTWVNATQGLRPLNLTTEYTLDESGYNGLGASTTNNLRFATNPVATLTGAAKTINSLVLDSSAGALTVNGPANTLTLTSGALLGTTTTAANSITLGGFTGILTGASNEYLMYVTNAASTLTLNSPLTTVAAGLTKSGGGTLVLNSAASTYGGGTRFNQGLIETSTLSALGTGGLTFNGGGLRWAVGSSFDPSTRDMTFGTGNAILDTNGNSVVLANSVGNAGIGGLVKNGVGSLTLNAAASFAGDTTINGGSLVYGVDAALPSTNNVVLGLGTLDHATFVTILKGLQVAANGTLAGGADLTFTGNVEINGAAARTLTVTNTGTTTFDGQLLVLVDRGTTARTLTVTGAGDLVINSEIADGTAAGGLAYTGTGTLTMTGFNTYSGTTTMNNQLGTLVLDELGRVNGPVTINAGNLVVANTGANQTFGLLTMGGGTGNVDPLLNSQAFFTIGADRTINPSAITYSATNNNLAAIIGGDGTLDLGNLGYTVTVGNSTAVETDMFWQMNTLTGSGIFTKTGLGTLDITGITNNSFTGSYQVNQGGIVGLETVTNNIILNGGVFEGNGSFVRALGVGDNEIQWLAGANGGFAALGGALNVNLGNGSPDPLVWDSTPSFVSGVGQLLFGSGSSNDVVTFANNIDLNGATRQVQVIDNTLSTNDKAVLSGILSNGVLEKTGSGFLELSGSNSFSELVMTAGTLQFSSAANLGPEETILRLNGGTLGFIGASNLNLSRPIVTTASGGLNASGTAGAIIEFGGPVTLGNNNALTLSGTGEGRITGGIIQPTLNPLVDPPVALTTADLTVASGTWTITGPTANYTIADDLLINGGVITLEDTIFNLNDDVVVTNAILNLNDTGVLNALVPTGTSSALHARNGATININADDVFTGIDLLMVGDATAGAVATVNLNSFNMNTPRLDLGGIATGLEGLLVGTGTITSNYTGTDYAQGFRFFRGTVNTKLAGSSSMLKQGLGDVTLTADNSGITSTVATRIDSGNLFLDYSLDNNNKISGTAALDMRGGNLILNGGILADTTQNVASFTLASGGMNTITVNSPGAFITTLNLGAITRANSAGTVRFFPSTLGSINTTTANNAVTGMLGTTGTAFATINDGTGTYFAINDGTGKIVPLTYGAPQNNFASWLSTDNVTDDATGFSGTITNGAVNSIRFDGAGPSTVTIGAAGTLVVGSGGILQTSNVTGGASSITGGGRLVSGTNELVVTTDSANQLFSINARISGATAITKAGNGTLLISGFGDYSGATQIQGGTLQVSGGQVIGDNSAVTLSDDRPSLFQLLSNETIGSLAGGSNTTGLNTLAVVNIGANRLTISGSAAGTYNGEIVGTGTIIKTGTATQTLAGVSNNFTGNLIVNQGQLSLTNRTIANFSNLGSLTLNNGTLLLDFTGGTEAPNKINNAAPVTLINTGGLDGLRANNDRNDSSKTETLGALTFLGGANTVTVSASSGSGLTQRNMTITAASLVRSNRSTLLVRGQNLGTSVTSFPINPLTNAPFSPIHTGRFVATAAPTATGGAGAVGTTTLSIVPWAVGSTSITGTGDSFVAYAATTGFRPLDLVTEFEQLTATGAGTATNNVRFADGTDLTLTSGTARAVNSLLLANTGTGLATLTGNGSTLNVVSGAFLATGNQPLVLGGFSGITSGALNEYIFHISNTAADGLTLNSPFTTTAAAFTKSGVGLLKLTATGSTYTGPTTLNQGALQIDALDKLGNSGSGGIVFNGGALRFGGVFDPSSLALTFGVTSTATVTNSLGGTLDTNGFDIVLANAIGNGGNGGLTKAGLGSLTLNSPVTFTGATSITGGSLVYGVANALPSGRALTLGGGTLDHAGFTTSLSSLLVDANSGIAGAAPLNFTGLVEFNGAANRILTINNSALTTFSGSAIVVVDRGTTARTMTIDGTGNVAITGELINGGAAGTLLYGGSGTLTFTGISNITGGLGSGNNLATVNIDGMGRILGGITVTAGQTNLLASGQSQTVGVLTMGGGLGNVDPLLNSQGFLSIGSGITLSPSAITYVATNNNLTSVINGPGTLNLGSGVFAVTIGNSTAVDIDMSWEMGILEGSGTIAKTGLGTLDIRGIGLNNFTGAYQVNQGAIIGLEATNNNFTLNGGVFESNGSFTRSLGTGPGEFQWAVGANGGFAANGGAFSVNIGNGSPDPLVWRTTNPASGTPLFVSDAGQLLFGSSTANDVVTLTNNINLDNGTRTIQVIDNTLSTADKAILSGVISNGTLNKTGTGILELSGANTFSSLVVTAGTLQFATASNDVGVGGSLGLGEGSITLSGGTLSFIGGADFNLQRPLTTTASSGLNASGLGIGTFSGLISMAANNVLTLSGTGTGVISGGITQPAGGATADVVMAAGSTAQWTITGANSTIADDLLVNGGTLTLENTVFSLNDDVIVSNPGTVLNLNSTGVLATNNPAGTSSGLYSRNGATINLNANNINGFNNANGMDFVLVGDATVGAVANFNTNTFSLTTPQFVVGGVVTGLEGLVTGTGTITATATVTDWTSGFLFRRGEVQANLAGGATIFKSGLGTVILSGDNSGLSGSVNARTRLDAGNLILDYTTNNIQKINSVRGLDMRGGALTMVGNASAATFQSVLDLILTNGGANTFTIQAGAGQTAALSTGLITRAAGVGTLRVNLSEGASFNTTTTNDAVHGLLGLSAYLTVKDPTGTWFARNSAPDPFTPGPVLPLVSTAKNDVTTWLSGDHVTDNGTGYVGISNGTILNSLRFDASDGSVLNLNSQLRINSGGILVTDNVVNGSPGILGGQLISGVTEFIVTQDSIRDFTISANFSPNASLTKTGNGSLVLAGYNSYTGVTQIQAGALIAAGGNAIGDNSPVTLADDRTTSLVLAASETIGRLAGGSTTDGLRELATVNVGAHTLTINNTGANTTYSGRFEGSGSIVKNGVGTNTNLNLNNISAGYTGSVVVNGGLLQLSNIGQINASAFTVNKNASLLIDNDGTTRSAVRILDTTPITLNSADGSGSGETIVRGLWIRTNQNAATNETVGNLVFNSGANYLTGQASGGTSATAQFIANDFIRQNNATVNVRATNLGATANARNQFRIGTAATQTAFIASSNNLVGGTGGVGTVTQKIVPWAIGENVATTVGNTNMGNTLVTYISAQGFVPLSFATDYALYNDAYSLVNTRESLLTDLTGLVGKNVNSLVIHNDNTSDSSVNVLGAGADQLLRNVSGAFLFTLNPLAAASSNHTVTLGGFDAGIATTNSEYVFHVVNPSGALNTPVLTTNITSPLVTAASITKSGRGTLVLSGVNTAGGGAAKTTLNEGALVINDLDNIGGNSGNLVFAGGTLVLGESWSGDDLSLRSLEFLPGGGTLNQGFNDLVFANSLGSGAGGFTKLGFGSLTLNAPATYTGPTNIVNGSVILGADNAIGSGDLTLGGGTTLELNGRSISVGSVTLSGFSPSLNGSGEINSTGNLLFNNVGNTVIDADITATGGLVKAQTDTLTLNGAVTLGGPAVVSGGTLLFSAGLDTSSVTLFPGTTLGGAGIITGDVYLTGTVASPATLIPGVASITTGKEAIQIEGTLSLGEHSIVQFAIDQLNFTALELDTLAYVDATTRFSFTAPVGYIPEPGSSFQVVTWVNGLLPADLSNVILDLPTISGIVWSWDVSYDVDQAVNKAILRAAGTQTAPVASALTSQTVNTGDSVTFTTSITGSHVYLIRWQKDNVDIPGETGLTYTIPAATFDDAGVYTVIASNEYGDNSKSATLSVRTAPVFDSQPPHRLVTVGSNFQLPVVALGPDPKTFVWTQDTAPITQPNVSGTTTTALTFTAATLANAGTYQVAVENAFNAGNPVLSDLADVVVVSQPQPTTVPEGNMATFSVTAAGNAALLPGLTYKWRRNGVDINDGPEFTGTNTAVLQVLVTPATAGANYSVRIAGFTASSVTTNGALLSFGAVTVAITQNPTPQILPTGATLVLNVQATGGLPMTFQWRLNGKNIAGATQSTLNLYDVVAANAGSYTCVISNNLSSGSSTATTTPVDVAVVDTTPRRVVLRQGSGTTLSAVASGAVSYQWFVDNGVQTPQPGATTNKLVIPTTLTPGKHNYFCRVTGTAGFLDAPTTIFIYNAAPEIDPGFTLPNTLVGAPYEFQVPMVEGLTPGEFDHTKTAAKFVAKGLPPGLVIGVDGVIRGSATVAGTFANITITASNAIAPPSIVTGLSIVVGDIDTNVIGDFTGPIARHPILNGNLGGVVTLKTAKNGGYSGKLTMGASTYAFKGRLNVATATNATTTITVKRAKLTSVRLTFALSAATQTITVGSITDGVNTTTFNGWRNKWLKTTVDKTPALAYSGYYTLGLELPLLSQGNITVPQGTGYASFTVNSGTGKLNVVGKLADGTAFTTATYVGPTGQVVVFKAIYASKTRGSVVGSLAIDQEAPADIKDNTLVGTVSWWKPAQAGRAYAAGFGPLDLEALGSRYNPPAALTPVMGIIAPMAAGQINALVELVEANVESAAPQTTVPAANQTGFSVSTANKAVADLANNPRKMTLVINAKTGAISGKFTLSAPNPIGGSPAVVTRVVSYLGLIIHNGTAQQGWGYFLLPQLPSLTFPTATTTPILSGQAVFEKL